MQAPNLRRRRLLPALATLAILVSCSDNPAAPIEGAGDPENMSRITVTMTPAGTTTTQTSVIVDPDGSTLPKPPNAATGTFTLTKGTTYNSGVTMLNDLDPNNVIDITAEVKKEASFHRFFYTLKCGGVAVPTSGATGVAFSNFDVDTQSPTPQPVGLTFQTVVGASVASSTSCILHLELHHFESAKGDGLGSTFDTDLSLDFPVTIP